MKLWLPVLLAVVVSSTAAMSRMPFTRFRLINASGRSITHAKVEPLSSAIPVPGEPLPPPPVVAPGTIAPGQQWEPAPFPSGFSRFRLLNVMDVGGSGECSVEFVDGFEAVSEAVVQDLADGWMVTVTTTTNTDQGTVVQQSTCSYKELEHGH